MLRSRLMDGQIYGTNFIKIDWDNRTFIYQRGKWGTTYPSRFFPQDADAFFTEELREWLPEQ